MTNKFFDETNQSSLKFFRIAGEALELDSVTHARASADYAYNFIQWNIGVSSLWAWAIGVAPLKDTFHSIHVQPEVEVDGDGAVPGDLFNEHFPDLHAAVSLFSMGPFVPGDRIGYEDELILSRAYRSDGFLLRMSQPMTPIDNSLVAKARSDALDGPNGANSLLNIFGERFGGQIWNTRKRDKVELNSLQS